MLEVAVVAHSFQKICFMFKKYLGLPNVIIIGIPHPQYDINILSYIRNAASTACFKSMLEVAVSTQL